MLVSAKEMMQKANKKYWKDIFCKLKTENERLRIKKESCIS